MSTSVTSALLATAACVGMLMLAPVGASHSAQAPGERTERPHRLLVLTDIEADPDDTQTLVRLLLYANVIDIEGLVATTSVHQRTFISPESIREVIDAYASVHRNLTLHDPTYPTAETLRALVKKGQPVYGMAGVGDGKDSEGSEWIIKALEAKDDRPLWVTAWGGPNTLAQALHKIKATRSPADAALLIGKLRVYTISDQDDTGNWMRRTFPDLFYIVSPGGYGAATWIGINWVAPGIDNSTISNRWLAENVQQGHGPLGAIYPDVAYGMEGDTPSWLSLVPNGLNAPERPNWGGWGGRYDLYRPDVAEFDPKGFNGGVPVEPEPRAIWTNAVDEYAPITSNDHKRAHTLGGSALKDFKATIVRWRDDFQNDFAARMDWTVKPRAEANHPPAPRLRHPAEISVRSGERFELDARGTTDPDGDSLSFFWFQYPEAGTSKAQFQISSAPNMARVGVTAPTVTQAETTHFILRVTDKGRPPLSRYRRVVVTVSP